MICNHYNINNRVSLFPDQNKVSLIGLVNLLSHKKKNNLNKTHNSKTASLTTIQKCIKFDCKKATFIRIHYAFNIRVLMY